MIGACAWCRHEYVPDLRYNEQERVVLCKDAERCRARALRAWEQCGIIPAVLVSSLPIGVIRRISARRT